MLADLYSDRREVRRQAADDLTTGLDTQLHVLTHVFNTLLADKMIDDRLRAYPSWVSSMNLYNEVEDRTVEALISSVTSRYDIVQRYYHLKRKMLDLPELTDYDRYAPLPHLPQQTVPWPDARRLVLEAMDHFSPQDGEQLPRNSLTGAGFTPPSWKAKGAAPLPIPVCRRSTLT